MIEEVTTKNGSVEFDPEHGTTKRWLEGKTALEIDAIKTVFLPSNIVDITRANYKKNKRTMTDKQRIDAIEIILKLL